MDANILEAEQLTTWAVTSRGERVCLGFRGATGQPCTVSLPASLLSGLMMTIPRMLRQALEERFADSSPRMVHELGDWRVERATRAETYMLSLATPEGFEVTFALPAVQADRTARNPAPRHEPALGERERPLLIDQRNASCPSISCRVGSPS